MNKVHSNVIPLLFRLLMPVTYIFYQRSALAFWQLAQKTFETRPYYMAKFGFSLVLALLICYTLRIQRNVNNQSCAPLLIVDVLCVLGILLYRQRMLYATVSNPEVFTILLTVLIYCLVSDIFFLLRLRGHSDSQTE